MCLVNVTSAGTAGAADSAARPSGARPATIVAAPRRTSAFMRELLEPLMVTPNRRGLPQNVSWAPTLKYLACRMLSGFSHAELAAVENVVLIAAGGSPAFDVAPTAALELKALKISSITWSFRVSFSLKFLPTRRSTWVRRGVYWVPGLMSGTTRDVLAPPDRGRPSVPAAASV